MHNRPPIQLTATIETNRRYHHTIYRIYKLQRHLTAESREKKTTKYQPLINNIIAKGWKVTPLMVIAAGARATTHNPSMKN